MLEAKDVNFAYMRGQPVIKDMDCKIEDGEFVALLDEPVYILYRAA